VTNGYIERTAIHFGTQPVTAHELRADWEKTRDRYPFAVAEVDGVRAGFAKTMTFRSRPAYGWSAEIGVYVDDAFHRRGVASALYQKLIEVVRAQGFHILVAGIALPNPASVALHEKHGFERVGVFPQVGFKLGAFHDVGFWALPLTTSQDPPPALRTPAEAWT